MSFNWKYMASVIDIDVMNKSWNEIKYLSIRKDERDVILKSSKVAETSNVEETAILVKFHIEDFYTKGRHSNILCYTT